MQHRKRALLVLILLACGFTVISVNLIRIQLLEHDKFWKLAVQNHLHTEVLAPERGVIVDAQGDTLAQTEQVYDLHLDGAKVTNPSFELPKLANALGLSPQTLLAAYRPDARYLPLLNNVDDLTASQVRDLPYVRCEKHSQRFYPNGNFAAQLIGMMDDSGHGLTGVEKEMDPYLRGVAGLKWLERDAKHQEIAGYQCQETPARDGYRIGLTLRLDMQRVVEDQLDQLVQSYQPHAAYIIVMQPQTGEVLAMGSRPNFDLNDRKTYQPDLIRNRCLTDAVEPGSIFKFIPLSAALDEGQINLSTQIFCENGSWYYAGRELKDDEPEGLLDIEHITAKSSNIGFAKLSLNYIHPEKLFAYATAFGIGHRTGLFEDQKESYGILHSLNTWTPLSITRVPIGQEVLVTPMQMVSAMSVIANGGRLLSPRIIHQVIDRNGQIVKTYEPHEVRQVISTKTAREVTQALEAVVTEGTGQKAAVPGFSVAGKTGTAQKFVDGAYSHTKFVSSFLGFMPANDPQFVMLVMVDEPVTEMNQYYGADVSAPAFSHVAQQIAQIMNLAPDQHLPALSINNGVSL